MFSPGGRSSKKAAPKRSRGASASSSSAGRASAIGTTSGRRGGGTPTPNPNPDSCSFCEATPAAVVVSGLVPRRLCLLHFYTSRSVRVEPAKVKPAGDGTELERQLPAVQELFAEAFTELKGEIAECAARAASASASAMAVTAGAGRRRQSGGRGSAATASSDPLAMLLEGGVAPPPSASRRRRITKARQASEKPSPPPPRSAGGEDDNEGGFVRDVPLPKRYVEQQRRMRETEARGAATAARGVPSKAQAAASSAKRNAAPNMAAVAMNRIESNPYKRRKPTRASIWNLALSGGDDGAKGSSPAADRGDGPSSTGNSGWSAVEESMLPTIKCTCGSSDVTCDGSISGRNQDMRKGETWGNKDRGDTSVVRYRCGRCGKTWNEEE